jgi:hypothetical protein
MELEDFKNLFWPPSRAPFGLEVLALDNRSLQIRAGGTTASALVNPAGSTGSSPG